MTKNKIWDFNLRVQEEICDKITHYIDVYSLLANEDGYLPEDASCDGIHLMGNQYVKIASLVWDEINGVH